MTRFYSEYDTIISDLQDELAELRSDYEEMCQQNTELERDYVAIEAANRQLEVWNQRQTETILELRGLPSRACSQRPEGQHFAAVSPQPQPSSRLLPPLEQQPDPEREPAGSRLLQERLFDSQPPPWKYSA